MGQIVQHVAGKEDEGQPVLERLAQAAQVHEQARRGVAVEVVELVKEQAQPALRAGQHQTQRLAGGALNLQGVIANVQQMVVEFAQTDALQAGQRRVAGVGQLLQSVEDQAVDGAVAEVGGVVEVDAGDDRVGGGLAQLGRLHRRIEQVAKQVRLAHAADADDQRRFAVAHPVEQALGLRAAE